MAIPKLKKQNIIDALKFIDENGVPEHNTSVKYVLVFENGKKYPPKYVVAVADHLANGTDISTESFDSVDARNYLEKLGFSIETKQQEKFELSITAESVQSTDERFTMDNLNLGDNYKPLDAYFKRANGDVIKRAYKAKEEIPIKPCPALPVRCSRSSLLHYPLRTRRTSLSANITRTAT
jgi:5-methylcytosine-specific restriction protein B